jgi:serine kinase of HPr protein (carbohydrate metabolism regulator)
MSERAGAETSGPGRAGAIRLQATCVAIEGAGVLLRGPSGAGKSDLALRLIDGGAALVADDLVEIAPEAGRAVARLPATAPAECRGRLELRGIGILPVPAVAAAPLALVVELRSGPAPARLPAPETIEIAGISVPRLALDPFEASAPARIRLVLRRTKGGIIAGP